LKSLGSANHPNNCIECHFYVFNTEGCKMGSSCGFCHELHPRQNHKKNRRFMKQALARGLINEVVHGAQQDESMIDHAPLDSKLPGLVTLADMNLDRFSTARFMARGDDKQALGVSLENKGRNPAFNLVDTDSSSTVPKSLGSAAHPDNCIECHFHVFNPGGCKAGSSCAYCHELHPRANRKKNRRFIKQALMRGLLTDGTDTRDRDSEAAPTRSLQPQSLISLRPDVKAYTVGPTQRESEEDDKDCDRQLTQSTKASSSKSSSGSDETQTSAPKKTVGHSEFIKLRYCDFESKHGTQKPLYLVLGVRTRLDALLEITTEKEAALKEEMEFRVEPPLPEGLVLDRKTGQISGVPSKAKEAPSVHRITISVDAICPGGMSLGMLALTSCTVVFRVLDFQNCTVSPLEMHSEGEEGDQFVLKLQRH